MSAYRQIPQDAARAFCHALFESYGFSPGESILISDALLAADFAGFESHGLQRVIRYHEEITSGCVDTAAQLERVFETPLSAVYDAHKAMGQLAALRLIDEAVAKAQSLGFGMITARNVNHIGIAGYYAERAAAQGLIGICMTNTESIAVPPGGAQGMLGTNPLAFAMEEFSLDMSTTVVPRGAIEVYAKNHEPLPEGWAVDAEGRAAFDAASVIKNIVDKAGGGILPAGAHKGYGLGIIVEICAGLLSGGLTSNHINRIPGTTGICVMCAALDYGMFGEREKIREALKNFLQELRECPKAAGNARILVPGERKAELTAQRRKGTIPVSLPTLDELRSIAHLQGVAFTLGA